VKLRLPCPSLRVFSTIPLMASVPPLLTPPVSKYASTWAGDQGERGGLHRRVVTDDADTPLWSIPMSLHLME